MKKLMIAFGIALLLFLLYFIYGVYWTYILNSRINDLGNSLHDDFKTDFPLLQDSDGFFYIKGKINGHIERNFILDTKATSMSRMENLMSWKANYWGTYPRAVKNLYGQQEKLSLYELKSLMIGDQIILKPLFKGISASNTLYQYLGEKDIIGEDIMKHFIWKFSFDNNRLTIFSNKNDKLFDLATQGYTKIPNGIMKNSLNIYIPQIGDMGNFNLDLGFYGDVCINQQLFEIIKSKGYKYIKTEQGYEIPNVEIKFGEVLMSNCTLLHIPVADSNLVGANFMRRFNFILAYQKSDHSSLLKMDLFIKPRKNPK